jgi:hypothetical protein
VVARRRGHLDFLGVQAQLSCAPSSFATQLSESKPAVLIDNPAARPL